MALNRTFYIRLILTLIVVVLVLLFWDTFNTFLIKYGKPCQRPERKFYIRQNGRYWILYNYVRAKREFCGNESITYTTHGEFTYLDNIEPLIMRWQAPMSIAIYACGSDFEKTLDSIRYLRNCSPTAKLIQEMITFHIFFHEDHIPIYIPKKENEIVEAKNCTVLTDFFLSSKRSTYRTRNKLLYPINIARNIARHEATTYYVFPLDIELYPSENFVEEFLEMAHRIKLAKKRSVFVVPIFEMKANYKLPHTKTKLRKLLKLRIAIPFHLHYAFYYHAIPNITEWINHRDSKRMQIFEIVQRPTDHWEPFYVTVNKEEPFYEEHFSYEGKYNKRIQGDILTLMNYSFIILDKAFLMHRPGLKIFKPFDKKSAEQRRKMDDQAHQLYRKRLWKLYGQTHENEEMLYLPEFAYNKVIVGNDADAVEENLDKNMVAKQAVTARPKKNNRFL